ncbi:hypothetical protein POM88_026044 [Heracleum sosnowskyi]|uniref:Uncharacterized protein n=1 Tax=Heracleum sosnowskyi TaxID=360622 RepID=A0AAD8I8B4_9APIA|nr:hypothetical protein POM88_026044 [Heracleum sosnowskyi]
MKRLTQSPGTSTKGVPQVSRKGNYLFVEHSSSLSEALCGFQFTSTHLDGWKLLIKSEPGEISWSPLAFNQVYRQVAGMNVKKQFSMSIEDEMHGKKQVAQEAYNEDEDMHRGGQRV